MLNGRYTVVYENGDYRTLRFVEGKNAYAGKVIASYKDGNDWQGFGFLLPENKIRFWRKFEGANPPERIKRIAHAVDLIAKDPSAAQLAYAMREKCCARCGRELSVPASLHRGLGPECASKPVKRVDNVAAYQAVKQEVVQRVNDPNDPHYKPNQRVLDWLHNRAS